MKEIIKTILMGVIVFSILIPFLYLIKYYPHQMLIIPGTVAAFAVFYAVGHFIRQLHFPKQKYILNYNLNKSLFNNYFTLEKNEMIEIKYLTNGYGHNEIYYRKYHKDVKPSSDWIYLNDGTNNYWIEHINKVKEYYSKKQFDNNLKELINNI